MLHAAVLRSPHAHAGIRGIDKRAALAPARRACGHHLRGSAALDAAADRAAVGAEPGDQASLSCRIASPATKPASSASRSRSWSPTAATSPRMRRRWSTVDYEPLPAASDCVSRARARRAAARIAGRVVATSRRVIPINVGNTDAAFAQARACLSRANLPASRRAVLHGMPRHDRVPDPVIGGADDLCLLARAASASSACCSTCSTGPIISCAS